MTVDLNHQPSGLRPPDRPADGGVGTSLEVWNLGWVSLFWWLALPLLLVVMDLLLLVSLLLLLGIPKVALRRPWPRRTLIHARGLSADLLHRNSQTPGGHGPPTLRRAEQAGHRCPLKFEESP